MRGTVLVLFLFMLTAIFHLSRWAFPEREELPAFFHLQPQLTAVVVIDDRERDVLYQFNDGSTILDVIKLTCGVSIENSFLKTLLNAQPIVSGELVKVSRLEGKCVQVKRVWLSARHRILLQIPLHPDRMTADDWEDLPGIGTGLAQKIENDRQKNGDFKSFSSLERVSGLGPKRLEVLEGYFADKKDP